MKNFLFSLSIYFLMIHGADAQLSLVKDLGSYGSSDPENFTVFQEKLFFSAFNAFYDRELWVYDPRDTLYQVVDLNFSAFGSYPEFLTQTPDALYFTAYDHRKKSVLWKYNGHEKPQKISDLHLFTENYFYPRDLVYFKNRLFFTAQNGFGTEIWVYDGLQAPHLWLDLESGTGSSQPTNFCIHQNKLFFTAHTTLNGHSLWSYDGVSPRLEAELSQLEDIEHLTSFQNKLFFSADDGLHGNELWLFDSQSVSMLADLNPWGDANPTFLTPLDNTLYFSANDGAHGRELWQIREGKEPILVADIFSGNTGSSPSNLTVYHQQLIFSARDSLQGVELWAYDGTSSLSLLGDINPEGSSNPADFTSFREKLFFSAQNADQERTLYAYSSPNPPLATTPIRYFKGWLNNHQKVVLEWEIHSESPWIAMEIEKSKDGQNFEKIKSLNPYEKPIFQDNTVSYAAYYRLKVIAEGSPSVYSERIYIELAEKTRVQVFPNPVLEYLYLDFAESTEDLKAVHVFDQCGKLYDLSSKITLVSDHTYKISLICLPPGVYILSIGTSRQVMTQRLLKLSERL